MLKELVIVGGGSAGMAVALEARRLGIEDILILEYLDELGGVLNQCIHSGFGLEYFKENLTGPEYASRFIDLIHRENIPYRLNNTVAGIDGNTIYAVSPRGTYELESRAIVLATGARERSLSSILLEGNRPKGIYSAGTMQELINKLGIAIGERIVVIGSGDIGLIVSRRMVLNGKEVVGVFEKESRPSGLEGNLQTCIYDFEIPLYTDANLVEILGKDYVEGVRFEIDDEVLEFQCDTIVYSIGLIPERRLILDQTDNLFIAGNANKIYGIVDEVTKNGQEVAREVFNYLKENLND